MYRRPSTTTSAIATTVVTSIALAVTVGIGAVPRIAAGESRISFPVSEISRKEIGELTASSTSKNLHPKTHKVLFRTENLYDGILWSSWAAARSEKKPKIRFNFLGIRYLVRVSIVNGNVRTPSTWRDYARVARIILRYKDGEREFMLKDTRKPQMLDLGRPVETDFVELIITELYPGKISNAPPAISEISLYEPSDVTALKPEMKAQIIKAVEDLKDPGLSARAMVALENIGAPAMPWLAASVNTKDSATKARVVEAIGKVGSREAIPLLMKLLKESDRNVVRAAVVAVGALKAEEAVPTLVRIAEGKDKALARLALIAMENIGGAKTLTPFLRAVIYEDEEIARIAIRHLVGFGTKAVLALDPYLRHRNVAIRARAIWAVGRIDSPSARRILRAALDRGSLEEKLAAIRGLGESGTDEAFDIVTANADHEKVEVRRAVADALGGFSQSRVEDVLKVLLKDSDSEVRDSAMNSLVRIGPRGLAVLAELVTGHDPEARQAAMKRLATSWVPGTIDIIVGFLAHPVKEVQEWAIKTILERSDGGLPALANNLGNPDPQVRLMISRYLADQGRKAVPVLKRTAQEGEPTARVAALRTLAQMAEVELDLTPLLLDFLNSPNVELRRAAVAISVDRPSPELAAPLLKALEDEDKEVRARAVEAVGAGRYTDALPVLLERVHQKGPDTVRILWALGEIRDPSAVPEIAILARNGDAFTRQRAVEALGKIGGNRSMAILMDALTDPDPSVRKAAEAALSR